MLSSVMQQVKTPAKEKERKSEGLGVASLQDLQPRTPDPLELYEDTVRGIAEIWKNLANKDILPTKMDDVFGDCIKPSRKFRQRLIKGLDDARAAHLHNSLVWLNQLHQRHVRNDGRDRKGIHQQTGQVTCPLFVNLYFFTQWRK